MRLRDRLVLAAMGGYMGLMFLSWLYYRWLDWWEGGIGTFSLAHEG